MPFRGLQTVRLRTTITRNRRILFLPSEHSKRVPQLYQKTVYSYRGVANKYINRYNALFSTTYRNAEAMIKRLMEAVLAVTSVNYYHSNQDMRTVRLLAI